MKTAQLCPHCGKGWDTDGDGNCAKCARLSDEELSRIKSQPYNEVKRNSIVAAFFYRCFWRTLVGAVIVITHELSPVAGVWIGQHGWYFFGAYAISIIQASYIAMRDTLRWMDWFSK